MRQDIIGYRNTPQTDVSRVATAAGLAILETIRCRQATCAGGQAMAIDRTIWTEAFAAEQFPTFPCPRCNRGRVAFDKTSLVTEEPKYSDLLHQEDGWEPNYTVERFSVRLRCPEQTCGEIVIVSGNTAWIETVDEEYGWGFTSVLRPTMMFPSPPIIPLPKDTPSEVEEKMRSAFGLFWFDLGSSANSLRMSVEFLLDHLKVPRTSMSKKTGKLVELTLNNRIQYYEKSNPGHGETFSALRMIGNLGSHEASLTREALLDAFEIYEDALSEIIGGRSAYLDAIKKKIIASKGKY